MNFFFKLSLLNTGYNRLHLWYPVLAIRPPAKKLLSQSNARRVSDTTTVCGWPEDRSEVFTTTGAREVDTLVNPGPRAGLTPMTPKDP